MSNKLREALERIAALDPSEHTAEGLTEWGEAEAVCFGQAQVIAREALAAEQPKPEPVAWYVVDADGDYNYEMTTIESEYARLKALAEAATQNVNHVHVYAGEELICKDDGTPIGHFCNEVGGEFFASAHDMMALIERMMEERKADTGALTVAWMDEFRCRLMAAASGDNTRDAGPSEFGGRKTRRDHHD